MLKFNGLVSKRQPNVFQLRSQQRNFQKIVIQNPLGVKLLNLSKVTLRGIGIFYASALVLGIAGYYGSAFYLEPKQHISSDWGVFPTIHSRFAVYNQDIVEDEYRANHLLIKTLRTIAIQEGIELEGEDRNDESKFKLLNLEQLTAKSKEWQATYIDIVIRLAIAKLDIGDYSNSRKLVNYAINVPMNIGSRNLKSMALRLASRYCSKDNELDKAESYLLDGIRYIEFYESDIHFRNHDSYLLDKSSNLNSELFNSLVDLGVLYTKKQDYVKSIEIFLNLLQIIEQNSYDFIKVSDAPMLKNYIGEILYKRGLLKKSIEWCNNAFKESYPNSRSDQSSAYLTKQILTNLVALYDENGDFDLKNQSETILNEVDTTITKQTGWSLFYSLFS